ncbi:MAG: hypothetical protein ACTTKZ_00630 [Bacteroides sp.]
MYNVRHLGNHSTLPQKYDPTILEAIPRLNAIGAEGYDVWHAYEICCLCENGLPATGILKMRYSRSSHWIVESKSLKLYLYSLTTHCCGETPAQALLQLQEIVAADLSQLLQTEVRCKIHTAYNLNEDWLAAYPLLETLHELPQTSTLQVASHLLGSLCPVTQQPDWGTFVLQLRGEHLPTRQELLALLLSKRGNLGFHEEITDQLYNTLQERYAPTHLFVTCLYTRRGGIDICPVRASELRIIPEHFVHEALLPPPSFRR